MDRSLSSQVASINPRDVAPRHYCVAFDLAPRIIGNTIHRQTNCKLLSFLLNSFVIEAYKPLHTRFVVDT